MDVQLQPAKSQALIRAIISNINIEKKMNLFLVSISHGYLNEINGFEQTPMNVIYIYHRYFPEDELVIFLNNTMRCVEIKNHTYYWKKETNKNKEHDNVVLLYQIILGRLYNKKNNVDDSVSLYNVYSEYKKIYNKYVTVLNSCLIDTKNMIDTSYHMH
jgi:hypothetical protein